MEPIVIESPYRELGKKRINKAYLKRCILDCIARGETPYASHRMLTDALDDNIPEQRTVGLMAGIAMARVLRNVAFYVDLGWSEGMLEARAAYDEAAIPYEIRRLH